jgi:hypothetical protein
MSFGPNDLDNYTHLRGLLDAFQKRVLTFCSSPEDEQVREARLGVMRDAFTGIGGLPADVLLGCSPCPPGEHCEAGACVPDTADSGMPAEPIPQEANNSPQNANSC